MTTESTPCKLLELLQEQDPNWTNILNRLLDLPAEAEFVEPTTNRTALHYFIDKGPTYSTEHQLGILKRLLKVNPGATLVACHEHGYTPLAHAVSMMNTANSEDSLVEEHAQVVQMLVDANKESLEVLNKEGLSPLDLHIQSVSRNVFCAASTLVEQASAPVSSAILQILAASSSRKQLEAALGTLYACNTLTIMERYTKEEARAHQNIREFGRQTRASTKVDQFWVWEWVMILLEHIHNRIHYTDQVPFHALHVASQISDCPPPFLLLAMRVSPSEVRAPTDRTTGNLPLHQVASWQVAPGNPLCRKSMTLTSLVHEYPAAMDQTNQAGQTPMTLEVESSSIV